MAPNSDSFGRLTIKDKGPEFLRCSLKSVSELKIIHLEISDNLLAYRDAKKISKVLKDNPPLRVLNLSNNLLDVASAYEISNALLTNSNLLELDLSYNKIGDQGIAMICLPIAKQRLRALMMDSTRSFKNTNINILKLSV